MITFFLQAGGAVQAAESLQQGVEAAAIQEPISFSLIDMALKGGWIMIPLLLLSLIAIYIFGERWWALRQATKEDPNFMRNIRDYVIEGKISSAQHLCQTGNSPTARVVGKGLERMERTVGEVQSAMENTGNMEVAHLERGLPMLATIAGGAPMLGFLGTVIGMVQAFYNMSQAGNNIDITLLSGGIYTAMVTTVAGLVVGILAYFGYNYLATRVGSITNITEGNIFEFVGILHETGKK